jgi:hypothetical protein
MKKITIKNLIDFRRIKSEKSKKTFVNNLKRDKKKDDVSAGNYWSICLGAIGNVFKHYDLEIIDNKIKQYEDEIRKTERKQTKDQFQCNIEILLGFRDFDFESIRPDADLDFPPQKYENKFIDIKGFPVQAWPHHVFTFSKNGSEEIGAIWFVAKKEGYENSELGMFADIMFRYLDKHYSKDYYVNPDYCIAVDVVKGEVVNYSDITNGKIPILIEKTIEEIKRH